MRADKCHTFSVSLGVLLNDDAICPFWHRRTSKNAICAALRQSLPGRGARCALPCNRQTERKVPEIALPNGISIHRGYICARHTKAGGDRLGQNPPRRLPEWNDLGTQWTRSCFDPGQGLLEPNHETVPPAAQSPDLPPLFSSRRIVSMTIPLSTAFNMS